MPEPTEPSPTVANPADPSASAGSDRDETAAADAARPTPAAFRFAPPTSAGEVGTLGPYRVTKELGKGGMGAVYLAVDTRLDRTLALKVMLPEFAADRAARERFLREAKTAAKISHDNVVTVYEADERDGVPYIAMQLLKGYPLDEFLKRKGAPPLPHVIRIARETALGLAAAHQLGLVHRDVKPANLWLEAPNGRVKVLDFGLAKPIGSDGELTRSGAVVGTPAYMSPEQARGQKVDHRTDIFSLGAVLYRLCTGRPPFTGPNVMAVLMALGNDAPAPVRELNQAVPEPLAHLIHQLLAKDPDARPQTATEVAKRLRAILDGLLNPSAAAPTVAPSGGADISTSLPVVVHPVPAQPPAVAPLPVSEYDVFAEPIDDEDSRAGTEGVTEAASTSGAPGPLPARKGRKFVLLAAAGAVLLAAAIAGVAQLSRKSPIAESGAPDGSAALPVTGTPEPAPDEWINLFTTDESPEPSSGAGWVKRAGQWISRRENGAWSTLSFPRTATGGYDLRAVVSLNDGAGGLLLTLPVADRFVDLQLNSDFGQPTGPRGAVLELVTGKKAQDPDNPTRTLQPAWEPGRRMEVVVSVRIREDKGRAEITVRVPGADPLRWSGPPSDLALRPEWLQLLPPVNRLRVGAWESAFALDAFQIRKTDGEIIVLPGQQWKPIPVGTSPFDKLNPAEIPKGEQFDWQPKELVAVIGSHARRHWGAVNSMAVSPDGKLAATVTSQAPGMLTVWDVATGEAKWRLDPPRSDGSTCYAAFAPDGRRLFVFSSGAGARLTVYDLTGPEPVGTSHALPKLPDGQWPSNCWSDTFEGGRTLLVAVAGKDPQLGLIDVSGEVPRLGEFRPIARDAWVSPASAAGQVVYPAPDGKYHRATIKGAKFAADEELAVPAAGTALPRGASPDGKRLIIGDPSDGTAQIWDVSRAAPKMTARFQVHGTGVWYVFSPDGRWLAAAGHQIALLRIDGAEPKLAGWLDQTGRRNAAAVAFSADGNRAVVGNGEGLVRFWDLSGSEPKEIAPFDPATAFFASDWLRPSLDRRGELLLPRYETERTYQLWNLSAGRPVPGALLQGTGQIQRAGGRWTEHGWGRPFRAFEVAGGGWQAGEPFGEDTHWIAGPAEGPALVAFAGPKDRWRLEGWDVSATPVRAWSIDWPDPFNFQPLFAVSEDGRTIAAPRKTKTGPPELALLRSTGGRPAEYAVLPLKSDVMYDRARLSPDGRYLGYYSHDTGETIVFDLTGTTPRELWRRHLGSVLAIAFHPDGQKLVCGGEAWASVLEAASGNEVWKWSAPGRIEWAEFAHDGRHLVIHNGNKTVYVLRLTDLERAGDRKGAEWALAQGGVVRVSGGRDIKAVGELPKGPFILTWVNLNERPVTDAGLARLAGCDRLVGLHLQATAVSDAGLLHFKGCTELKQLNLNGTKISDAGLANFKGCTGLKELSLGDARVKDAGLSHFKDCKSLTFLLLDGTAVTDTGLASFQGCAALSELHLMGTAVTDMGLARFKDCKALTVLNVRQTKVTAKGLTDFHAAVPGCRIEHDGGVIEPVAAAVDRAAAEYALSRGGTLQVASRQETIAAARDLPREPFTLTAIFFDGNRTVTDADVARFKGCKGFNILGLSGTKVTGDGLAHFRNCKSLRVLYLASTGVTDAGLARLKDCRELTHLYLANTGVTDAGLIFCREFQGLQGLELSGTKVTDVGLAHFKEYKNLFGVWLARTAVTDASLEHLKGCKGLTVLDVKQTKVTANGVSMLHTALPNCTIEWDGGKIEPKK